ncbi:putative mitochondrial protein, partial [Mucuna pruriens]
MVCKHLQFCCCISISTRGTPIYVKYYIWDDPYLWRLCNDQVIRRCIPDTEINSVLQFFHAASGSGHYGATRMAQKVLDWGFYWPTIFKDAYQFVSTCEKCQKVGMGISRRHEMPQQPILFCEFFDVWAIDFMGPFLVSNSYSYILLVVDYVSRWIEAIATKINDAKVVVNFLKSNIFCRFGVLKALISDQGSHFCNKAIFALLHKYQVKNDQAEVFNREIKKTLQKIANPNQKDRSRLLEDALWAHRTAYRTLLGMSPYWIIFSKSYHLLVEIEHRAYLALQELDELRLEAYANYQVYKQKVKQFHDQQILRKEFRVG